jgi:hypothetical protein
MILGAGPHAASRKRNDAGEKIRVENRKSLRELGISRVRRAWVAPVLSAARGELTFERTGAMLAEAT